MPSFEPFRAIRYADRFDPRLVTAPPYDVVSHGERERLLSCSDHNVVAIDMPTGDDAYAAAAGRFAEWRRSSVLIDDEKPSFTVYRMETVDDDGVALRTTGVIGAMTLSRPGEGEILPHEFTTPKAKSDRLDLLRATRANLSAVWGLSPSAGLTSLLTVDAPPLWQFDADGVTHTVWRLDDPERVAAISAAIAANPIVIADGHHRYETSLAHRDERVAAGDIAGDGAVMCFVVELVDDELFVGPIHRQVSGVPDGPELLEALADWFDIAPFDLDSPRLVARLQQAGALGLITRTGQWSLAPRAERFAGVRDLDSSRLDAALAGFAEATLIFEHDPDAVRTAVREGDAVAGVFLRPVTIDQIVDIARGGERMPPKSTFFTPKLRTGVVFRSLL